MSVKSFFSSAINKLPHQTKQVVASNEHQEAERELLRKLRNGDQKAVSLWYKQYAGKLLAIANRKLGNPEDAEELVQETFINCLRQLPLFRGESKLLTWMQSILYHQIADYYRKLYAKKTIRSLPLLDKILAADLEDAHEISLKVRQVLTQMVKSKQELLQLKYVDKKKVTEIAQKLGKTVKAVESDLFRAREEFRDLYLLQEEQSR